MKKSVLIGIILFVLVAIVAVVLIGRFQKEPAENVLVWVDGVPITLESFQVEWRRHLAAPTGDPMVEDIDAFLEDMITEKLFLAEARRRKIDATDRCRREVNKYREQMMVEALLNEEVLAVRQPNQAEIESFWVENSDSFSVPELKRVSHILIKPKPDETEEEIAARCQEVMARLDEDEDFAELAEEVSEGSSAAQGGDLGYFRPGQLAPELEAEIENLELGEVGGPVKSSYGYHIIVVVDKKPPRQKDLPESRQQAIESMLARTRKAKFEALKSRLESSSEIEKDQELIGRLRAEVRTAQ